MDCYGSNIDPAAAAVFEGFAVLRKKQERHFDLSIYLIKAGVTDHAKIVPSRTKLLTQKVMNGRKTLGTLYVSYKPKGRPPSWTDLMRGGVEDGFLDGVALRRSRSLRMTLCPMRVPRRYQDAGS